MFLEFCFRRGLFLAKTPNSQFYIWLPRETSDQKIERDKKLLEFNFGEGLFFAQMPNPKIFI